MDISAASEDVFESPLSCQFVCGKVRKIKWSPKSEDTFATGTWDGAENSVGIWRCEMQGDEPFTQICDINLSADVTDLKFVDHSRLLCSTSSGDLLLLNASDSTLSIQKQWQLHNFTQRPCPCTCFSVNGSEAVTAGEDGALHSVHLNRPDASPTNMKSAACAAVYCIRHYARDTVVVGTALSQLQLWDIRSGTMSSAVTIDSSPNMVTSVACHPAESHLVAVGTQSGTVGFCDLRRNDIPPSMLATHSGAVWELSFHPQYPDNLFSCSDDGSLLHWDASTLRQKAFGGQLSHSNPWLIGESLSDKLRLSNVLSEQTCMPVNCLDLNQNRVICGTDSQSIVLISDLTLR